MKAPIEFTRNLEGDGYVATVRAHDGAEIELQFVDETDSKFSAASKPEVHKTWEILWSRGTDPTLHHLSLADVRSLGEALVGFADLIQAKGGRA